LSVFDVIESRSLASCPRSQPSVRSPRKLACAGIHALGKQDADGRDKPAIKPSLTSKPAPREQLAPSPKPPRARHTAGSYD
jgi:hypothetical protein